MGRSRWLILAIFTCLLAFSSARGNNGISNSMFTAAIIDQL